MLPATAQISPAPGPVLAPPPRGELSAILLGALASAPFSLDPDLPVPGGDPLADEDLHLSLYLCYELHYRGVPGADERWEWEPSLLALRARLERRFEAALEELVPRRDEGVAPEDVDLALRGIAEADSGRSLSACVEREAGLSEVREFLVHRSAYQLKEADPHSWALPRMYGAPKGALVQIQADEYGNGDPERIHAKLFADTMDELGLDTTYGAYLDNLPGVTLATVNLMSFFGLHRRWRGAIIGHLALFEMESSVPNRRYAKGLRRLGFGSARATEFFDEHVTADAIHVAIAAVDLAGGLARQEPELTGDILWGAATLAELDGRWARMMLGAWAAGASSLLISLPEPASSAVAS
ncbi:MAG TPA: iron-containing redox enzyme family protein [Solirubrobacteraceae bacterium]|nr:iron-containing redox enzyme family protein [Solirubrobacteraceae bacterium]